MDNVFHGFQSPNYTETPNEFFDDLLAKIDKLCELKVTLAAFRQTFGWHRTEAELSIGFLERATHLSRTSVREGIALAVERGTMVKVREETNNDGAIYAVVVSDEVRQRTVRVSKFESQNLTPTNRVPKSDTPRDTKSVSQNLTPNKEKIEKEKKENLDSLPEKLKGEFVEPVRENSDIEKAKTDVRDALKAIFIIPPDFDFTAIYALCVDVPTSAILTRTAHQIRAMQSHGIFDFVAYKRAFEFQAARAQRNGGSP
jgi:hypothetical protein